MIPSAKALPFHHTTPITLPMPLQTILTLLCVVCFLVGTANAGCSQYTSCEDCVCSFSNYERHSPCLTAEKCGWCPTTSTCYSSPHENNVSCPGLVGAWQVPEPADDDGDAAIVKALCGPSEEQEALEFAMLFLTAGVFMCAWTIYTHCRLSHRNRLVNAAWLRSIAAGRMPNGESVQWEGCSERVVLTFRVRRGKARWAVIVSIVSATLPPILWLLFGRTSVVLRGRWGLTILYFFGIPGMVVGTALMITCIATPTIYGYAISNQHVVEATAELDGWQDAETVQLHPITTIEQLRVTDTSVSFWSGSTNIVIRHQQDTTRLYQYLSRRRAWELVPPAGAGAGEDAATTLGAEPAVYANAG